jgi:hypothetical protein
MAKGFRIIQPQERTGKRAKKKVNVRKAQKQAAQHARHAREMVNLLAELGLGRVSPI